MESKEAAISFLKEHFFEDQETKILSIFEHQRPIFLSDVYCGIPRLPMEENTRMNLYEHAYVRLLLDFGFILVREKDVKISDARVLYELLSKKLYCIAVDYLLGLLPEELELFKNDKSLIDFLSNILATDGNIKYMKEILKV